MSIPLEQGCFCTAMHVGSREAGWTGCGRFLNRIFGQHETTFYKFTTLSLWSRHGRRFHAALYTELS